MTQKNILLPFVMILSSTLAVPAQDSLVDFEWQSSPPAEQGMSPEKLDSLLDGLKEHATDCFFIVRNDRVICEWYAPQFNPTTKHSTASLAKALVGGMSLIVALQDGLVNIDDPASRYIRQWKDDPTRAEITIRHLATHSSGLEDAEGGGLGHLELGGWKTQFWKQEPDPFTIARDWAPMKFKPGSGFEYSNPGMAMLSYVITTALQNSPQRDIRALLRDRIMRPIGVDDSEWSCGYGKTFTADGLPLVANWGGGSYTARAAARVGRLMLQKGNWEGKQLINAKWVDSAVSDAGTPDPYRGPGEGPCPRAGLAWWVNSDGNLHKLPKDAFMGAGAGNQVLLVIPSLNAIAVRFGEQMTPGNFWGGMETYLFNPLLECIMN